MRRKYGKKRRSYKVFVPLIVAMTMLGVSYSYWGESFAINVSISTANIELRRTWGMYDEVAQKQGTIYYLPEHTGSRCSNLEIHECNEFPDGSSDRRTQDGAPTGVISVQAERNGNGDASREMVKEIAIEFSLENTGDLPVMMDLTHGSDPQQQTWIKVLDGDSVNDFNREGTFSTFYGEQLNGETITVTSVISSVANGLERKVVNKPLKEVILYPGEIAVCKAVIEICDKKDNQHFFGAQKIKGSYVMDDINIEAQFNVSYRDIVTGSWREDTCNTIFVSRKLVESDFKSSITSAFYNEEFFIAEMPQQDGLLPETSVEVIPEVPLEEGSIEIDRPEEAAGDLEEGQQEIEEVVEGGADETEEMETVLDNDTEEDLLGESSVESTVDSTDEEGNLVEGGE